MNRHRAVFEALDAQRRRNAQRPRREEDDMYDPATQSATGANVEAPSTAGAPITPLRRDALTLAKHMLAEVVAASQDIEEDCIELATAIRRERQQRRYVDPPVIQCSARYLHPEHDTDIPGRPVERCPGIHRADICARCGYRAEQHPPESAEPDAARMCDGYHLYEPADCCRTQAALREARAELARLQGLLDEAQEGQLVTELDKDGR